MEGIERISCGMHYQFCGNLLQGSISLNNITYMYYYSDLLEIRIMFQFCFAFNLFSSTCT